MNSQQFRACGYELVDFCADLIDQLREKRDPFPSIAPGYIKIHVPAQPPEKPEPWAAIMADIEPAILSGMTFWQHPSFYAYFPSGNSWPSILGDLLCNAFAGHIATWEGCPVSAELETIMMDWCAKMFGLPKTFLSKLSNPDSTGGGCIQTCASECILLSMLVARENALLKHRLDKLPNASGNTLTHAYSQSMSSDKTNSEDSGDLRILSDDYYSDAKTKASLIAYGSSESHSCFEKACMIAGVRHRLLRPEDHGGVSATILIQAITEDTAKGLIPFYYNSILGSTATCSFDSPLLLGPICESNFIWMHCDCAYAGGSFCCPEMRYLINGMEHASSMNINANKWMNVNFDCSLHWIRDRASLNRVMGCRDLTQPNAVIPSFRYWSIPTTRRFRALKLWFTLRMYGISGMQKVIRRHIYLAKLFESLVKGDDRFEIVGTVVTGLCCFRLKGKGSKFENLNAKLLQALNFSRKIYMVPASFLGRYCIRFAIASEQTTEEDVKMAWELIADHAHILLTMTAKRFSKKNINDKLSGAVTKLKRDSHGQSPRPSTVQNLERYFIEEYDPNDALLRQTSIGATSLESVADLEYERAHDKQLGFGSIFSKCQCRKGSQSQCCVIT